MGKMTFVGKRSVIGLFTDENIVADTMDSLKDAGYSTTEYEVLTGTPYPDGTFGEAEPVHKLFRWPLIGAACGFIVGLVLTAGTQLAYPLVTGGKPILSIPPMTIIIYEGTMLGAIIFTVIGVIFEARPEAAVQIATLALKSSNAVILKGGHEASRTNEVLVGAIQAALGEVEGVSPDAVQLVSTREEVRELLELDRWIDLIIPRGSNELVQSIQESTRIPVLGHADGICSVYIDRDADERKAVAVSVDAKTHYPAACNACETLLVHRDRLPDLLPIIGAALREAGVEVRADEGAAAHLESAVSATAEDYDTEFLDKVLAVKTVSSIEEAVEHINSHGSHHTDAIVTEDAAAADYFLSRVDSAGVFHNASTRFADGFRFGLGAEVGISTNKTHARGPVGLEGLVIYKYRLYGRGHVAADYDPGARGFLHEDIEPRELP